MEEWNGCGCRDLETTLPHYHVLGERDTCGGQEGVGVGPYVQQTDRQPKQSKAGWRCCVCAALWK